MAAKDFWTRAYVDQLVNRMLPAFGEGAMYNVRSSIDNVMICGDLRRNANAEQVKHLCLLGVCKPGVNIADLRGQVKANIQSLFMGETIKRYMLYDYVMLPDGSGNVSWLIVPEDYAGAAAVHATGPVPFIKMIELFAEKRGLKFGASGLKRNDEKLVTRTEDEFFKALGATFVPLHEREQVRYLDAAR